MTTDPEKTFMTTKQTSVLLIEDDAQIRQFLKVSLEGNGFRFLEALHGKEGLAAVAMKNPEVVILDLGLPDLDGLTVLKNLREWSKIPVIVLTARGNEEDKIKALDAGADDYLTKPFGVGELLARLRVALRHAAQRESGTDLPFFENAGLRVDYAARRVSLDKRELHLTPTEYKLLVLLTRHAGKVLTQRQILTEVWGAAYSERGDTLRVHMHQLRHKVEKNPARPRWIITEPGVGYRFEES